MEATAEPSGADCCLDNDDRLLWLVEAIIPAQETIRAPEVKLCDPITPCNGEPSIMGRHILVPDVGCADVLKDLDLLQGSHVKSMTSVVV